ncbi:glycosyltransferase [Undibacterium sp. TJN19]|uniref:glycosyltransferase n=1 Tax=Undibacterium sp. TJN19 TaxID=3413055 RepID=UPI003BF2873E
MRILIDLQACQSTGSRHRGIGRYSLALAKAMAANAGQHEIWMTLSGLFPETIAPLRATFADLIPQDRIITWRTPGPVAELVPDNYWRSRTAELVREQAFAALRPDFVHTTSLFEGSGDDAVASVGLSSEHLPTAVTLYDLIPLVYEKQYLCQPDQRAWYYRKLASLKRADLLLAISDFSRQEGINLLQLPPERVVSISSAVDAHFQPRTCSDDAILALRQRYGLKRSFVMYTGGIDIRKNIDGLITAYAGLPPALRQQHQLAIVCSVQHVDRQRIAALALQLGLAEDEIVLTGFVPDADLPLLYQDCKLFVFPSWHEGFGLPALEAMSCGAPVIAANTSSLPEVLGYADALFNPRDTQAITAKMVQALEDTAFADFLRQHGLKQARNFSWDASAKKALRAFEDSPAVQLQKAKTSVSVNVNPAKTKPKLAYLSPLPPLASGIANYSADLLPELADYYDITLIVGQDEIDAAWLSANFAIRDSQWFIEHAARFDRILYHFGNSPAHAYMYPLHASHPGVVVLHDYFLGDSQAHLDLSGTMPGLWAANMYQSHGYPALLERRDSTDHVSLVRKYPCSKHIADKAEGVIVHSACARDLHELWNPENPACTWTQVPLLRRIPGQLDRQAARAALGLTHHDFLLCTFGMLGATKLNDVLLQTWLDSALANDQRCHLVFVGKNDESDYGAELEKLITDSPSGDRIRITGFTDAALFSRYLQAADGAVQLRAFSRGETSAAVLECMAYGLPVIVNKNGSMAELPEDAVFALPDSFNPAELLQAIVQLRDDAQGRAAIARKARALILQQHAPAYAARHYFDAIENFFANEPSAGLHRTLDAISNIRPVPPEHAADWQELARSLTMNSARVGKPVVLLDLSLWCQAQVEVQVPPYLKTLLEQMLVAKSGVRIEPVWRSEHDLHYARAWTCEFLGFSRLPLTDDIVQIHAGDIYLSLSAGKDLQQLPSQLQSMLDESGIICTSICLEKFANEPENNVIEAVLAEFMQVIG